MRETETTPPPRCQRQARDLYSKQKCTLASVSTLLALNFNKRQSQYLRNLVGNSNCEIVFFVFLFGENYGHQKQFLPLHSWAELVTAFKTKGAFQVDTFFTNRKRNHWDKISTNRDQDGLAEPNSKWLGHRKPRIGHQFEMEVGAIIASNEKGDNPVKEDVAVKDRSAGFLTETDVGDDHWVGRKWQAICKKKMRPFRDALCFLARTNKVFSFLELMPGKSNAPFLW
jgi:hypothetical protein